MCHPTAGRGSSTEAGYALVDMVASLAILAIVVALLPPAFRHVQRALSVGTELEARTSVDSALFAIESRLREALAVAEIADDASRRLAFRGEAREMTFVAPIPSGSDTGGLARLRIGLEPDGLSGELSRLILRSGRYNVTGPRGEPGSTIAYQAMLRGSARFLYFGVLEEGAPSGWHTQWSRADRLPELVSVEVLPPNAEVAAKVLTVAPRLGVPRWSRTVVND